MLGVGELMFATRPRHRLDLHPAARARHPAHRVDKKTVEGPVTTKVPASIVQMHRKAILIVDQEAAELLDDEKEHEQFVMHIEV